MRLQQKLQLTPQLVLQMKLLQVTALDLEQLVRQEIEDNPALEETDDMPETREGDLGCVLPESVPETAAQTPVEDKPAPETQETSIEVRPGEEYTINELMPDDGWATAVNPATEPDDGQPSLAELTVGPAQKLTESLLPYLRSVLSGEDARVAEFIVESLDDDGFLTMSNEEIAQQQGVSEDRVIAILHRIQRIEPGGIACHDRRESFLVQLELRGVAPDALEWMLLTSHWDLLMKKQTKRIARLCRVSEDEVRRAVRRLLALETRPARAFAPGTPEYVSPDFSVAWQEDQLVVRSNDERVPRLRLAQGYVEILRAPESCTREQVQFARAKLQRAVMFLRAIESRRRTLKRLVELVVEQQYDFFLHGEQHLRPATLKQAAGRLQVHPSTVSRAVAGKYLETEHGIFPLSHFFKAGTGNTARTSIKDKLAALVSAEDKQNPLTDDEICSRLEQEGIEVSRRTVAKYRVELGIPSFADRKGF